MQFKTYVIRRIYSKKISQFHCTGLQLIFQLNGTIEYPKEDLPTAFNGIKSQLNSILKSNQLFQDYALLNGFLAFVHSKLNAAILTSIESQCGKSFAADLDSFDQSSISSILDFSWESVHYPIFKWFQMWRNYILFEKENKNSRPNLSTLER